MYYARYVDDIVVLCDSAYAKRVREFVMCRLEKLGLEANDKQQEGLLGEKRLDYLGYVFYDNQIDIRPISVRRIEQRIESLLKRYVRAPVSARASVLFELKNSITGCIWQKGEGRQLRFGWAIYYAQATKYARFVQLDRTVLKMDARFGAGLAGELPKFSRVYYEVRYHLGSTKYIPHYGSNTPIEEKRRLLSLLGIDATERDDEWVDSVFTRRIQRMCRKLDRDVVGGY